MAATCRLLCEQVLLVYNFLVPTKQPVLGLAILTSFIRDLYSSLFVVIWFPVH